MEELKDSFLQCRNITMKKGSFTLSDITFSLPSGYILGVIGRNGVGKTTLLRTLLGSYRLVPPYGGKSKNFSEDAAFQASGDILLNHISIKEDVAGYKQQTAFVLNDTPFFFYMSAKDCGKVYKKYYKDFSSEKYFDCLNSFKVPISSTIGKLSKGEQIKQQLAFALSYPAKLYILDEPAANLDTEFREIFYQHLRTLTADGTKSIIYVSHLVDDLEHLADYILWLGAETKKDSEKTGIQKYFGSMEDLREEFQLIETDSEEAAKIKRESIVGIWKRENHQEMLVRLKRNELPEHLKRISRYASLKEIMYYTEKGEIENETALFGIMDGK